MFYLRETKYSIYNYKILKPFEGTVWITFSILLIIFWFILKISFQYEKHNESTSLLCFGAFCQQTYSKNYFSISARCLIIFLFISSLLIHKFYTSNLISNLVETKRKPTITNKNDLARSNVPIGFCDLTTIKNFVKVSMRR